MPLFMCKCNECLVVKVFTVSALSANTHIHTYMHTYLHTTHVHTHVHTYARVYVYAYGIPIT